MCLIVLLGLLVPRVALALLWLFEKTQGKFDPWWLGLLGFLFLPYTTLTYVLVHLYTGASPDSVVHLLLLLVALILDTGAWSGTRRRRREA